MPPRIEPGSVRELIIAGWTGRDQAALEAHIRELEALGVARPGETPAFYPMPPALLTHSSSIAAGRDSTGEAEAVLFAADDGLWVRVGSDHTDRKLEAISVVQSKQACPKPVSREKWRFDEVEPHWDSLILRSHAVVDGTPVLYQEGPVAALRHPRELIALYEERHARTFAPGFAMFCGTLAVKGGVRWADTFAIELEDQILGRRLTHSYEIRDLESGIRN